MNGKKPSISPSLTLLMMVMAPLFLGAPTASGETLLLKNIAVFDGTSAMSSAPQDLLIKDGGITAIGKNLRADPNAKTIDATGKAWTVMPGLFDLHAHLRSAGSYYFEHVAVDPFDNARTQLYAGVTTVVDLLTESPLMKQLRAQAKREVLPDFLLAGRVFTVPLGHGAWALGTGHLIADDSQIEREFKEHLALAPDVTKAILEGGLWFKYPGKPVEEMPTLTEAQIGRLAKLSRAAGLPFFVHIWTLEHAKMAVRQGATALAHGVFTANVDDGLLALMKTKGTAYIPTLSVVLNRRRGRDFPLSSSICPALMKSLQDPENTAQSKKENIDSSDSLGRDERFLNNLKRVFDAGIPVGIGTDAGNPAALQGPSVHQEIDYFVEAGIPLADVMKAATSGSAKILGQKGKNVGRIARGMKAHLVIVDGDPLTDPKAHVNIVFVIKDGKVVDRDALVRQTTRAGCGSVIQ